jgi:hypothetical protein
MSTVPVLFRRLVDDAAVFPPGNAPLDRAIDAHVGHQRAPYAEVIGRFIVKASELNELPAQLDGEAIAVSAVADGGVDAAAGAIGLLRTFESHHHHGGRHAIASGVAVECVEIPLDPEAGLAGQVSAAAHAVSGAEVFVEIPPRSGWRDAVAACADERVGAKLRTGGLVAAAFPSPRHVGDFVAACVRAGVPFKCTAGLHRAVTHSDPLTGFHHHGFLNVLVATHAAITGADVLAAVTARDPHDLAAVCWGIDDGGAAAVRAAFTGFGSCSVADPIRDLAGLGLIDPALADALPPEQHHH